jgi:hypothetical protein
MSRIGQHLEIDKEMKKILKALLRWERRPEAEKAELWKKYYILRHKFWAFFAGIISLLPIKLYWRASCKTLGRLAANFS